MNPNHGLSVGGLSTNPFATRWTRPGRITPRDALGRPLDVTGLVRRFHGLAGAAALEGEHGSGKTNLLTAIAAEFLRDGTLSGSLRMRGIRDVATAIGLVGQATPGTTVCIDGWEAMGPFAGGLVRWLARLRRCRLLVTSHRPTGMPLLWRCETSPDLLASLVDCLPSHAGSIDPVDIRNSFSRHDGNLREALFDLYDLFERRRRDAESAALSR